MTHTFRLSPLRRTLATLLAGLATSLAPMPSGAVDATEDAARWYRVEVVIFEHRDLTDANAELWPADAGAPELDLVGDVQDPPAGFTLAANDDLELRGAATQLSRSGRYTPLAHLAWTQQGLDQRHAIPLRVTGGVVYPPLPTPSLPESSPLSATTPVVSPPDTVAGTTSYAIAPTPPVAPEELHQLDGTLTLVLGRYLHLYTDLIDRRLLPPGAVPIEPQTDADDVPAYDNGQTLMSFRVREHRKMRSQELHYIDHPVLGLLVKVVPVAAPNLPEAVPAVPVPPPAEAPPVAPPPSPATT